MDESRVTLLNEGANISDVSGSNWTSARSLLLGIFVGSVFLFLSFRETSYQGFVDTLLTAHTQYIVLGIGLYALYLVARALRWSLLLAERAATRPFTLLLRAVTWGNTANIMIPRSGEFLRAFVVRKPLAISATSILGSIAAERFYDLTTVIVFTGLAFLFFEDSATIMRSALLVICTMGALVLAGLLLLGYKAPLIIRVVHLMTKILPQKYKGTAQVLVDELSVGIRTAFSNPHLVWIGVLSVCQWLCITGCIYLSIESFEPGLSPWIAFIVLPLTIAGVMLPTAPVYLGTIQACFLLGLVPFGVSNEVALAASVAYTSIITLPVITVSIVWYLLYIWIQRQAL